MQTLQTTKRLLVTRQDPASRHYARIGELQLTDAGGYLFVYDDGATRPLPGLPLGREHRSDDLFSIFAERVMHPHRPDYAQTLEHLGLPIDAVPFEVLAVSGGRRTGDAYELTPIPERGEVELPFLVHGIRHLSDDERARVDALRPGDQLELRCDSDNEFNDRALLVTREGSRLGFVPDPLVEYVHQIITGDHQLTVERVNSASAGFHMRLLVTLRGTYPG